MNFRRTITWTAVILACVWIASRRSSGGDGGERVGQPAADFSLLTIEGQPVKLSSLKGSVVVLDFWATWCPPCQASLPNLNRLSADPKLATRGVKVIAINAQEQEGDVKAFLQANHESLPVALDSNGAVARLYKVDAYPTTILVGRDGLIQYATVGYDPQTSENELHDAIEKALAK